MAIIAKHDAQYRLIGIDKTKGATNSALKNLDRLQNKAQRLTRILTGVGVSGLAIGGGFLAAVRQSSQFSTAMSDLSAITGATGKDLDFLRKKSLEFGQTSTLSASQSAEAFKLVASSKPDLLGNADALARVTREAITLSEASGVALPESAKTLGQALNQFNADASESARFINVLAAGAKFGASEIEDTGEALLKAGVIAKGAGVSFEETNAAIQALAAGGIKGADAGTALRNILLRLQNQANNDFNPAIVGTRTALDNLAAANLTTAEKMDLFGNRAFAAGQIMIDTREKFSELTEKMTGTNLAAEQAATKFDNLGGDVLRLKSAASTLVINLGSKLEPLLRTITQTVTNFTQSITDNMAGIEAAARIMGIGGALYVGLAALPVVLTAISTAAAATTSLFGGLALSWLTAGQMSTALTLKTIGLTAALKGSAIATKANIVANGVMLSGFQLAAAYYAGWKIGEVLSEKFSIVRQAGTYMVEGVLKGFEYLKFGAENAGSVLGLALLKPIDLIKKGYGELFDLLVTGLDKIPGIADESIEAFRSMAASMKQPTEATQILTDGIKDQTAELNKRLLEIETTTKAMLEYERTTDAVADATGNQTDKTNEESEAQRLLRERLEATAAARKAEYAILVEGAKKNSLTENERITSAEKAYAAQKTLIEANVADEELRADKIKVLTEKLAKEIEDITGSEAKKKKQDDLLKDTAAKYAQVIEFTKNAELEKLRIASEVQGLGFAEQQTRESEYLTKRTELLKEKETLMYEQRLESLGAYFDAKGERTAEYNLLAQEQLDLHNARMNAIDDNAKTRNQKLADLGAREKTKAVIGGMIEMTQGVAQHSKKLFAVNKAFALAQAMVDLPAAVSSSYAKGAAIGGPILGSIYGGLALGAQLAQINAIRSTSFSGGGTGTTPSSAGSVPTINSQPAGASLPDYSQQGATATGNSVQIIIQGDAVNWTESLQNNVVEMIKDAVDNKDAVIIGGNSSQAGLLGATG